MSENNNQRTNEDDKNDSNSISYRIEKQFNDKMINSNIPLFKDFEFTLKVFNSAFSS